MFFILLPSILLSLSLCPLCPSMLGASLVAETVKNLPAMLETQVQSLGWEISWRREWQPTPVFLPVEFQGQRSLEGYSPWGHKESDTTERLTHSIVKMVMVSVVSALK